MEHYVTLFNSLFIPQGLALHRSMERHVNPYTLWILCVDDKTFETLQSLRLSNVRLLSLIQLECDELKRVKLERSIGEFCWTLTPFSVRFVFEADRSVERVTYIDADIWFRRHPKPIFDELEKSGKDVLITDHGYAAEYDQSSVSGIYCVQFVVFCRNSSEKVRLKWEKQCIEWCFSRYEDGKFGDQKYLDFWPEQYPENVHVLKEKEYTLAPWNASRYPFGKSIFYHFHELRLITPNRATVGIYILPKVVKNYLYRPYLRELRLVIDELDSLGFKFVSQAPGFRWYTHCLLFFVKVVGRLRLFLSPLTIRF